MKQLSISKKFLIAVVFLSLLSCSKEETTETIPTENSAEIPEEIIAGLQKLGIATPTIEKMLLEDKNGTLTTYYKIQEDYVLSTDQILHPEHHQELGKSKSEGLGAKQYRTTYNIYPWRTISIRAISGGPEGLQSLQAQEVAVAVKRYNDLNLGIRFDLSYGPDRGGKDIIIKRVNWLGLNSGLAGFPAYGDPHHTIFLGDFDIPRNTSITLIAHEIGHCIGLRHTDYFDRASCGQNSNEGQGWMGAVHVPGTSTQRDLSSTMNSCVGNRTDFTEGDKNALRWMYTQ